MLSRIRAAAYLCLTRGCLCLLLLWAAAAGATEPSSELGRSGEEVFNQACFTCHGTGFYNAPVIGDSYAWQDRLGKGEAVLLESTLQGLNSMPPRGACSDCSDAELEAAVKYLLTE